MQRRVYGESQPSPEASGLRGKIYQIYDCAGVITHEAYDFKDNLVRETRRLAVDYRRTLDFSASVSLEPGTYSKSISYDALNRLISMTTPDGRVLRPSYNQANLLERIEGNLRGAAAITSFIKNIDYDAKGQRRRIEHGNGTSTTCTYDPLTFRLITLITTRGTELLQNLQYTYDPVDDLLRL